MSSHIITVTVVDATIVVKIDTMNELP